MEEQHWTELGKTVTGAIARVALDTYNGLLPAAANSAHRKLGTVIESLSVLQGGATAGDIGAALAGQFDGEVPSADLEGALRELARLFALHSGAGNDYKLYVTRYAFVNAAGAGADREALDTLFRGWEVHSRDVFDHAVAARRWLRSAASRARAAEQARRVFGALPRGSRGWIDWTSAAILLADSAAVRITVARGALRRMRDAVVLELDDVRKLVRRCSQGR